MACFIVPPDGVDLIRHAVELDLESPPIIADVQNEIALGAQSRVEIVDDDQRVAPCPYGIATSGAA